MYAPDPNEKFDFQNMDVKLYLALKAVLPYAEAEYNSLDVTALRDNDQTVGDEANKANDVILTANRAMYEFTQSFGPIPDWAVARNFGYELVAGAQLCTKDGRRTGNAHIITVRIVPVMENASRSNPHGETYQFECLTDAGSKFTFNASELEEAFTIGDWISDPARVLRDFDRNGEFDQENPL